MNHDYHIKKRPFTEKYPYVYDIYHGDIFLIGTIDNEEKATLCMNWLKKYGIHSRETFKACTAPRHEIVRFVCSLLPSNNLI